MTQAKRLLKLINDFGLSGYEISDLAEYLIANGVIVSPCGVGDEVYRVVVPKYSKPFVWRDKIEAISPAYKNPFGGLSVVPIEEFGKTAFLTREEAEEAVKKMSEVEHERQ